MVKKPSQNGNGRLKPEVIGHQRAKLTAFKGMIVDEKTEWTVNHLVLKVERRVEDRNLNAHLPPDSQMPGSPLNFLSF